MLAAVGIRGRTPRENPVFRRPSGVPDLRTVGVHRVRCLIAMGVGGLVWLVSGWPVAGLAAAILVCCLPWLFGAGKVSARRIERLEAIEDWLRSLADLLGPGNIGLAGAIQAVAHEAPAPIVQEVSALARRMRTWDVTEALLAFADQLDDQVGDAAVAGLCVAYEQGSGTAELLKTLAKQVAEEVGARRDAEAERARRRSTARILLGLWGLMFVSFTLLGSSSYTAVYGTAGGQVVLAVVLGVVGAAVVWLRRLGVEPTSPRFLVMVGRGSR
jgi:Flp pilus assembly protein TadB